MTDRTVVLDQPWQIELFHMRAQLGAMKMEQRGLRHSSGRSVHKFVKETYKLPGPRAKLIEQFEEKIKEKEKEHGVCREQQK